MKVKGLDGREYRLKLTGHVVTGLGGRSSSENHREARRLLKLVYPYDPPFEEVAIPGCGTELFLDFLLPGRLLAVEVQGRQHRVYVPHYHRSRTGFKRQMRRDALKREFCALNGLVILELHDDERGGWERAIRGVFLDGGEGGEPGKVGEEDWDGPLPGGPPGPG